MNDHHNQAGFLRLSLRGNAAFSFASGLAFSIANQPIAHFIGLEHPAIVFVVGLSLIVFAIALLASSIRKIPSPIEARLAVALDLLWVAASPVIISLGLLSSEGNWMTIIIADLVLLFAILQFIGLRRLNPLPT